MDTMGSSAFLLGPWLEELHVVLRDEASFSVQSPLQPARLLRWMHCTGRGERVRKDDVSDRAGGGCVLCVRVCVRVKEVWRMRAIAHEVT